MDDLGSKWKVSLSTIINVLGSSLIATEAQKCQKRQSYILAAIDEHILHIIDIVIFDPPSVLHQGYISIWVSGLMLNDLQLHIGLMGFILRWFTLGEKQSKIWEYIFLEFIFQCFAQMHNVLHKVTSYYHLWTLEEF